ncbi:hypothetical protein [Actinomadura rugatobispora]|uniref:Uncharacterized protein n=1 Tax=Actinomadura rugatobispora TaxID=1994 RepID=A0ABW1AJY8_9ACTN|nr:hypothetical protein GCM10010200_019870 [Actinomadura rugatobispora]
MTVSSVLALIGSIVVILGASAHVLGAFAGLLRACVPIIRAVRELRTEATAAEPRAAGPQAGPGEVDGPPAAVAESE